MERKWESTTQINDVERTNYKSSYSEWFSTATEKFLQLSLIEPLTGKFPNDTGDFFALKFDYEIAGGKSPNRKWQFRVSKVQSKLTQLHIQ